MKEILFFCCFVTLILTVPPAAHSENDVYAAFLLGATMPNNADATLTSDDIGIDIDYESGFALLAAAGMDFRRIRFESEVGYQVNDIDDTSGDLSIFFVLLNGYYDFETGSPITPYVSGGVGFASANIKDAATDFKESDNDEVIAYQLSAGLLYAFSTTTSLDFRYRYFATTDLVFDSLEMDFSSHNVYVGITKRF